MKIAYYLQRFPYLTETFILREMLLLREMGVDVQIFSLLPPGPKGTMHQQVQAMMPFVHYSQFIFSFKLIQAQFYFLLRTPRKYFKALGRAIWQTWPEPVDLGKMLIIFPKSVYFARQMQEMKIDHIHAHFVWTNGIAAQVAADLTGVTYSLHAHAWDIFQRNQECVRRQISLASVVVTVSEYHRQYIANLCPHWKPDDIRVVHYGLDPSEFTPGHVPAEENTIRIISVGSLVEKKGHAYLIEACALLLSKGYKFQCSIIGGGYLRESLQERIDRFGLKGSVFLVGAKNQTDVQDLYRHSDIFALACVIAQNGDRDGMPNVLLEAMAMELPVITTPVTGNPELVHEEENGLIVPSRDAQALASAIERLINDQALRLRLGKQGRQTILAGFDIRQTSAEMAAIFNKYKKKR
jgi:glycosyltransferase involved in cell wall biosynthesis